MATPGAVDLGTRVPGPFRGDYRIVDPTSHAFVTKLDPNGGIVFSARLGGSLRDRGTDIAVDAAGAIVIAGKTSSPDFPRVGARFVDTTVFADCALWTPELGFLAKLSADGRQLLFSSFEPLDGGQLDDCQASYGGRGTRVYAPARIALDASGNILVGGYTDPNNREIGTTIPSIIPASFGAQPIIGRQLFEVVASDGSAALYASALPQFNVRGLAVDRWQNVIVLSEGALMRLAPNALPVEVSASPSPACASLATTLTARVAGANDAGTVDFIVDGVVIGSVPVVSSSAARSITLAGGVRQIKAVYHGVGPFDGYASTPMLLAVNQAGACT
jgi:hypothetical protein